MASRSLRSCTTSTRCRCRRSTSAGSASSRSRVCGERVYALVEDEQRCMHEGTADLTDLRLRRATSAPRPRRLWSALTNPEFAKQYWLSADGEEVSTGAKISSPWRTFVLADGRVARHLGRHRRIDRGDQLGQDDAASRAGGRQALVLRQRCVPAFRTARECGTWRHGRPAAPLSGLKRDPLRRYSPGSSILPELKAEGRVRCTTLELASTAQR